MVSPTPPPPICYLLSLPPETLLDILSHLSPKSLSSFSQTSLYSNQFANSPQLFKELFLRDFDRPQSQESYDYSYKEKYKERIEAGNWASSLEGIEILKKDAERWGKVIKALLDIAITRAPLSPSSLTSKNQLFLQIHLPGNRMVYLAPSPSSPVLRSASALSSYKDEHFQAYSHLKALATPRELTLSAPRQRTAAKETVYRKDEWGRDSSWGPYFPSSKGKEREIDWKKVEALQIVTSSNLKEAQLLSDWGDNNDYPRGWESTRAIERGEERDWAGVDGMKLNGTYCFLDYHSYQHFNFHRSRGYTPTLADETEAVGECMTIELKLLPVQPTDEDSSSSDESDSSLNDDDEDEEYSPKNPSPSSSSTSTTSIEKSKKLAFVGTSRKLEFDGTFSTASTDHGFGRQPQRLLKGWVKLNSKNEVRWKIEISIGGTEPQWLWHGVQPGGPKSKFGILGTWSTAEHDDAGPNGPFWYWPVDK